MRRLAFSVILLLTACRPSAPEASASPAIPPPVEAPTLGPSPGSGWQAPVVPPESVAEAIARGEPVLFVDVRAKTSFDVEHLPGAVNAPWPELPKIHGRLPKDRLLVLYCACADEHSSGQAAVTLHDGYGFEKLAALKGGIDGWKQAGQKTWKASPDAAIEETTP